MPDSSGFDPQLADRVLPRPLLQALDRRLTERTHTTVGEVVRRIDRL